MDSGSSVYRSGESIDAKQYKIICVGDSMVGKTSLIQRYMTDMFNEHGQQPTISNDFKIKAIQVDTGDPATRGQRRDSIRGELVRLFVWDTAGQERFRQIARMYYRDSHGVIICYDITSKESFDQCDFWLKDIEKHAPEKAVKYLCGLKSDLADIREVDQFQAENFAKQNKMRYFEVSNKTGDNVEEMFQELGQKIFDCSNVLLGPKPSITNPPSTSAGGNRAREESIRLKPSGGAQAPMPVENKKGCC